MNLDENQKRQVAQWIDEGLKLSDIQTRLSSELDIKLTYMEVRFLVDDLKLTPKEPERVETPQPSPDTGAAQDPLKAAPADAAPDLAPGAKGVSVSVDAVTRPGALVSGKVTFSDGNDAEWYLDQTGRLGLAPKVQGYRPSAADVQSFQAALERELSRLGL